MSEILNLKSADLNQLSIMWRVSGRNPEMKTAIETELQLRLINNEYCSREYLLNVKTISNKVLSVSFVPTSNAFNLYGEFVTVLELKYSEELMFELFSNLRANPMKNTFGEVEAEILDDDSPKMRKQITFSTKDILSVAF